jgi:hypothetical protein
MCHRKSDERHGPADTWCKRLTFYSEAALKSALYEMVHAPCRQWIPAKMTPLARQQLTANGWLIHTRAHNRSMECHFTMDDGTPYMTSVRLNALIQQ